MVTGRLRALSPDVSVVVSTYNRAALVPRLVAALEAQEDAPAFEVIIVDNGSSDDTWATLENLQTTTTLDLRPIRIAQNRGPAPARKRGWQAARGDWVAFTDDDCVPQARWLAGFVSSMEQADIIQGQTRRNPEQTGTGWFSWAPEATAELGFYETCNIAYRRRVLAESNGFDEHLHAATQRRTDALATWGDDTELALRAKAQGARSTFAAEALVWHDVKPGRFRDRIADVPRRAGVVAIVKRHPDLRRNYESRWFLQRAHGWLLVGLAGGALVAKRPSRATSWALAAILFLPWARERGKWYPKRVWPRVLPQWVAIDVAEVVALARASVRNRTFFL